MNHLHRYTWGTYMNASLFMGLWNNTSCSEEVIGISTLHRTSWELYERFIPYKVDKHGRRRRTFTRDKTGVYLVGYRSYARCKMVVREELARVGLKPPIFAEEEKKDVE